VPSGVGGQDRKLRVFFVLTCVATPRPAGTHCCLQARAPVSTFSASQPAASLADQAADLARRRSRPERRSAPARRSPPGGVQSTSDRRSLPDRRSRPQRRSSPASRTNAASRSARSRSMSAVVRPFSRSRIASRSPSPSSCSSPPPLTTRASIAAPSSRSRSAITSASSRLSTTPAGVQRPGRRTGPSCRHRRTMTTRSRLPRIVQSCSQAAQTPPSENGTAVGGHELRRAPYRCHRCTAPGIRCGHQGQRDPLDISAPTLSFAERPGGSWLRGDRAQARTGDRLFHSFQRFHNGLRQGQRRCMHWPPLEIAATHCKCATSPWERSN
jgi:hypothetical protein